LNKLHGLLKGALPLPELEANALAELFLRRPASSS
jgi:hypothetical protein